MSIATAVNLKNPFLCYLIIYWVTITTYIESTLYISYFNETNLQFYECRSRHRIEWSKTKVLTQTEILSRKTNIIVKVICKYDTTYIWVYTCNALACENNSEMS